MPSEESPLFHHPSTALSNPPHPISTPNTPTPFTPPLTIPALDLDRQISKPLDEGGTVGIVLKFKLSGMLSRVPRKFGTRGACCLFSLSYPPFVACIGENYMLVFGTTGSHNNEDVGLTFPDDYGPITGSVSRTTLCSSRRQRLRHRRRLRRDGAHATTARAPEAVKAPAPPRSSTTTDVPHLLAKVDRSRVWATKASRCAYSCGRGGATRQQLHHFPRLVSTPPSPRLRPYRARVR